MLSGYNCTIFAYGQTGTGKTYTMSGDMNDTFGLLSDAAGIIPRVLHSLFSKLSGEDTESFVKCSFIELYNEELRDLMSVEENAKLKIFDDASRKGHATTIVQGMEEAHIRTAAEGIKLLQEGSLKRQVAATKCNDLSSRSHTVFTITACVKRTGEDGEDWVSAGKLNLVDLAGSENIQRSGAENKRAAEAGLINKSLLTLGRVINALVDHSSHIPYRESKLTRLLQDSLGGRTKTCIIATISPAKSNLEETISTLDYAFRAKNIRNKPQVNPMIRKDALLQNFTHEIEKLKSELIATRQRNGVYLSNESYEEMATVSESRRIQNEEQAAKIETLESNLRNKAQELFSLASSFTNLKKDHDATKLQLDETKGVLDRTELVLEITRKSLAHETLLREAHQKTEEQLHAVGNKLINTLHKTVGHVGGLHAKNKRKSDIQALNRTNWGLAQGQVSDITSLVENRIVEFQAEQQRHLSIVSERMQSFVEAELEKLSTTQSFLDTNLETFAMSKRELLEQKQTSKKEMDEVLEEIKEVRDNIKERVGDSLQAIATAAETIAQDVLSELSIFHNLLHASYSALGKDFKGVFEELLRHNAAQRQESDDLRQQLQCATENVMQSNLSISAQIQNSIEEERRQATKERNTLLKQITSLINSQAEMEEARLTDKATDIRRGLEKGANVLEGSMAHYTEGMDNWNTRDSNFLDEIATSRETLKSKLQEDWTVSVIHQTPTLKFATNLITRLPTLTAPRFKRPPNPSMPRRFALSTNRCRTSISRWLPSTTLSAAPARRMRSTMSSTQHRYRLSPALSRIRTQTSGTISRRRTPESKSLGRKWIQISRRRKRRWGRSSTTPASLSPTYARVSPARLSENINPQATRLRSWCTSIPPNSLARRHTPLSSPSSMESRHLARQPFSRMPASLSQRTDRLPGQPPATRSPRRIGVASGRCIPTSTTITTTSFRVSIYDLARQYILSALVRDRVVYRVLGTTYPRT